MPMLDIKFTKDKEYINKCVDAFNLLCEQGEYPEILEYTPFDLFVKYPNVSITLWKKFLLEPAILDWYASERKLLLQSQVNKLIREAGSSKSTASAQALSTLLKQLNETEDRNNNTYIIYNFIPVTEEELKDPLVNVTETIPSTIRDSIKVIEESSISNKKK